MFVYRNGFRGINRAKIGIGPTTVLDKDIPTTYTEDVEVRDLLRYIHSRCSWTRFPKIQATTQHEESIREYEQPSISRNSLPSAMQHKDVTLTIDLVAGTDSSFLQEKSSLRGKFEGSSPAESGTSIKASWPSQDSEVIVLCYYSIALIIHRTWMFSCFFHGSQ